MLNGGFRFVKSKSASRINFEWCPRK